MGSRPILIPRKKLLWAAATAAAATAAHNKQKGEGGRGEGISFIIAASSSLRSSGTISMRQPNGGWRRDSPSGAREGTDRRRRRRQARKGGEGEGRRRGEWSFWELASSISHLGKHSGVHTEGEFLVRDRGRRGLTDTEFPKNFEKYHLETPGQTFLLLQPRTHPLHSQDTEGEKKKSFHAAPSFTLSSFCHPPKRQAGLIP